MTDENTVKNTHSD